MAITNKNNDSTQSTKQSTLLCVGGCGKQKSIKTNFYKSTRKEYEDSNGYCNICKSCLSLMLLDSSTNKITVENFKKVCAYIDKPFILLLYNEIISSDNITYKNIIGEYISRINLKKEYKNLKYSDSIMFELQEWDVKEKNKPNIEVTDEMKIFWDINGILPNEDIINLQKMFDNFMLNEEKDIDYKKESDYKSLCIYELQKSKIQYDLSKLKDLETLQKMIDTLSTNLGIKATQKKEDKNNNTHYIIGLITKFIENVKQEPVLNPKDYMKNYNKSEFEEELRLNITAPLLDSYEMNNPFKEEWENEKKKYEPNEKEIESN